MDLLGFFTHNAASGWQEHLFFRFYQISVDIDTATVVTLQRFVTHLSNHESES